MAADTAPVWRVGIIGLGAIAQGYDTCDGSGINTHIKACLHTRGILLAAICDIDRDHAMRVAKTWGLTDRVFSLEDLLRQQLDIICVATPDATHAELVPIALAAKPRIVLCEKPLATNSGAGATLVRAAETQGPMLAVNFLRRWLPGVSEWIHEARAGRVGKPLACRMAYSRGWRHNACHGLDLIGAALGSDISGVQMSGGLINDFSADDPTYSVSFQIRHGHHAVPVQVMGFDGREQTIFELDIHFAESRLRIWDEDGTKVRIDKGVPLPAPFGPEQRLSSEYHDAPPRMLAAVWENLASFLAGKGRVTCQGRDVLDGMSLVDAVARAVHGRS